eukprot:10353235-Alexandrium_andersonii.AAC.1
MSASLVGSEMCIRDRFKATQIPSVPYILWICFQMFSKLAPRVPGPSTVSSQQVLPRRCIKGPNSTECIQSPKACHRDMPRMLKTGWLETGVLSPTGSVSYTHLTLPTICSV